jgi:GDP-4-dehydro-6-deoxy-D-mannose reductase
MRVLITGIQGFMGYHLSHFLEAKGINVYGIQRRLRGDTDTKNIYECDVTDSSALKRVLGAISPSVIFHMAAHSSPSVSWRDPLSTLQVNLIGTFNLLAAVRDLNLRTRVVLFGSSSEYAPSLEPISEEHKLKPSSPYALSKIAASLLSGLYFDAYKIDVVTVRPFFIIGPRKTGDACSSFAKGIVDVERGSAQNLKVGNLDTTRDFLDIDDAVRAFWLVSESGKAGEVYNISSGEGVRISRALEIMMSKSRSQIQVEQSQPYRLLDNPVAIGKNDKLQQLGWSRTIELDESLSRILDYWRGVK